MSTIVVSAVALCTSAVTSTVFPRATLVGATEALVVKLGPGAAVGAAVAVGCAVGATVAVGAPVGAAVAVGAAVPVGAPVAVGAAVLVGVGTTVVIGVDGGGGEPTARGAWVTVNFAALAFELKRAFQLLA